MHKHIKVAAVFISGILLGVATTVTAQFVTDAQNINLDSSKTEKTNVKDSLDELYSKLNDPNMTSENIKSGIDILGTTGTFTSDATADASKIISGYTAYVNGNKINGSMPIINNAYTKLESNESFTIPLGYHDGTEVVQAFDGIDLLNAQYTSLANKSTHGNDANDKTVTVSITNAMDYKFIILVGTTCGDYYSHSVSYTGLSVITTMDSSGYYGVTNVVIGIPTSDTVTYTVKATNTSGSTFRRGAGARIYGIS